MKKYFFTDENGISPVKEFLGNLPAKIEARIFQYLDHIVENDGLLAGVAFRKLHGYPLEEIRIKESKNLHRVIIKVRMKDSVVVLHGFTEKEGQKIDTKELDIALERYLKFKEKIG